MVQWHWVNFQCRGVLGQGPIVLAIGAGGGCLDIFTLVCSFSPLSPSLWETARYRLKYCLKVPLNPKQQTNQKILSYSFVSISFLVNIGKELSLPISDPFASDA